MMWEKCIERVDMKKAKGQRAKIKGRDEAIPQPSRATNFNK
jgi:hypothetical protein